MIIRRNGRYISKTLVTLLRERIHLCAKKSVNKVSEHICVYENFIKSTVLMLLV